MSSPFLCLYSLMWFWEVLLYTLCGSAMMHIMYFRMLSSLCIIPDFCGLCIPCLAILCVCISSESPTRIGLDLRKKPEWLIWLLERFILHIMRMILFMCLWSASTDEIISIPQNRSQSLMFMKYILILLLVGNGQKRPSHPNVSPIFTGFLRSHVKKKGIFEICIASTFP